MARTLELDTLDHPGNTGTANIVLSSDGTTTMPVVNINGGQIDATTVGASTPSSVAASTLSASGNATVGGTFGVTSNTTVGGTLGVTGLVTVGGTLGVTGAASVGALTATTLDTGQGANELYDMDQNVKTDSAVTFTTVNTGAINGMSAGEDASENLWLGTNALNALDTGGLGNTAVGVGAMQYDATGDYNTAFGNAALNKNTLEHNTAVGYLACFRNTGEGNTAVGSLALRMHTSTNDGSFNTAVGADALKDVKSGVGNAGLGVGAGTSYSPSSKIENQDNIICLGDDDITYLYCNTQTISSSDARDKTDVEDFTAGLDWVEAMRPITYHWDKRSWYTERDKETDEIISQTEPDGTHKKDRKNIGFIAQEVLEIEKVHGFGNNRDDMLTVDLTEDGTRYGMNYALLVPVLVNAIKELSAKVKALETA